MRAGQLSSNSREGCRSPSSLPGMEGTRLTHLSKCKLEYRAFSEGTGVHLQLKTPLLLVQARARAANLISTLVNMLCRK